MTRFLALSASAFAAACSATTAPSDRVLLTDLNESGGATLVVATKTADAQCAKDGKVAKLVSSGRSSDTYVCVDPAAAGAATADD